MVESSPRQSVSSRRHRTNNQTLRENGDSKQTHYNQRLKPKEPEMLAKQTPYNNDEDLRENKDSIRHTLMNTDQYDYERSDRRKTDRKNRRTFEPNITDTNNFHVNDESFRHSNHTDNYNHEHYQRTNHKTDQTSNSKNSSRKQFHENSKTSELSITDTSNSHKGSQREEWSDLRNKTFENGLEEYRTTDRLYSSTPRFEREGEFEVNPNLSLSTVTFSYKSSPTRRKPRKNNPEEMIW